MDGWVDARVYGGWVGAWLRGQVDECVGGWMGGWVDGRMGGWMDGWVHAWVDV